MGNVNVIHAHRRDLIKPERTLATVQAAGAFRAKVDPYKRKSTAKLIDEIQEWKFRRKDSADRLHTGRLQTFDDEQEHDPEQQEKEVLKFVHRVSVGDGKRNVTIKDTSVAWTALRESANRERSQSHAQERRQSGGWFPLKRRLTAAMRFIKRSSVVDQVKVLDEVLSYYEDFTPKWEKLCHICHTSSIKHGPLIPCRICPRIYHTDCMERRGYISGGVSRETVELSKTDIGWSCFHCENLFDLLSDTEKIDIMETFDRMDKNQDSLINREEYLEYQKDYYRKLFGMEMPGYRVKLEERTFDDMDRSGTSLVDWWEYLIPMCVRKLSEKKRKNLVTFLTKQEVYKLRDFFKQYDQDGYAEIGKNSSRMAFKNWYLSLVNLRREQVPVWDWLGTEWVVDPEPEGQQNFQRSTTVNWRDFVKNHALYILAARPNTGSMRPYVPRLESYGTEYDDEDDDNEYY